MEILSGFSANHFTFLEKVLKPRCVVLKGLPSGLSEQQVLSKLRQLNLKEVEFIVAERMWTHYAHKRNIQSNVFKVKLRAKEGVHKVLKIKNVDRFKVDFSIFSS